MTELQQLSKKVGTIDKFIKNHVVQSTSKQWLYVHEAEKLTGFSGEYLRKLFYKGKIKHRKTSPLGRKVQYLKSELTELFNL